MDHFPAFLLPSPGSGGRPAGSGREEFPGRGMSAPWKIEADELKPLLTNPKLPLCLVNPGIVFNKNE
jgi:hypothetical protein